MKIGFQLIFIWVLTFFWIIFDVLVILFLIFLFSDVKRVISETTGFSFDSYGGTFFHLSLLLSVVTFSLLIYFNIFKYTTYLTAINSSLVLTRRLRSLIIIMILGLSALFVYQLIMYTENLEISLKLLNSSTIKILPLYVIQIAILLRVLFKRNSV